MEELLYCSGLSWLVLLIAGASLVPTGNADLSGVMGVELRDGALLRSVGSRNGRGGLALGLPLLGARLFYL
jgi:hypothetical protein